MKFISLVKLSTFFICLYWLVNIQVFATHIVGGEIYYEHVGGNDYLITLKVYRDCGPDNVNGTGFDSEAHIGIYTNGNFVNVLDISLDFINVSFVPVTLDNPCFIIPPDLCIEEAIYEQVFTLAPEFFGYDLVYQRCCRNNSILNIFNADESGISVYTHIPGTQFTSAQNSAPVFNNFPPVALCQGAEFFFDHGATDADGDELVYSFYTPFLGGGPDVLAPETDPNSPIPNPPAPPAYNEVLWATGYSEANPISSSPSFAINPATGYITGTANLIGRFAIGIVVDEYRDGFLINSTFRDFQYTVTICDPNIIAAIPTQSIVDDCIGLTFDFGNESVNASSYYWDFGDPTTSNDNSTETNPSYTYPETGIYEVMLIANPTWPCADTVFESYEASFSVDPLFEDMSLDCDGDQVLYSFETSNANPETTEYAWDFGSNATPQFSTEPTPSNVVFDDIGPQVVSLLVSIGAGCEDSYTYEFDIPESPVADIGEIDVGCDGIIDFVNNSMNGETYYWEFDDPATTNDNSTEFEPTYVYLDSGQYEVTLVVTAPYTCPSVDSEEFFIDLVLNPAFTPFGSACFTDNTFEVNYTGTYSTSTNFNWDFGEFAVPSSSNELNPPDVSYTEVGTFPVSVIVTQDDCAIEFIDEVTIIPNPIIDFEINYEPGCMPLRADFIDLSLIGTTAEYLWNFGDGSYSSAQNPSHIYSSPGLFDVSLNISTVEGCVANLNQTIIEAILVHPIPTANFYITPPEVNILKPEFEIIDLSENAISWEYVYGGETISVESDFDYSIFDSGSHTLIQNVFNEFGCKNSASYNVVVTGSIIYIPNSFTPNGDGINDVFQMSSDGITKFSLDIYNRWGAMIYHSNDIKEPWLGEAKNDQYYAQNENYIYRVIYEDLTSESFELIGTITILR